MRTSPRHCAAESEAHERLCRGEEMKADAEDAPRQPNGLD